MLAQSHSFVVLNAFIRLDQGAKQKITTLDLVSFFSDNGIIMAEADCYMLVKQYDVNGNGGLSLLDLTKILCPRSYTTAKNYKASKKFFQYGVQAIKLRYEIEFAILKVIE